MVRLVQYALHTSRTFGCFDRLLPPRMLPLTTTFTLGRSFRPETQMPSVMQSRTVLPLTVRLSQPGDIPDRLIALVAVHLPEPLRIEFLPRPESGRDIGLMPRTQFVIRVAGNRHIRRRSHRDARTPCRAL